jgi:hypothetical protein
VESAPVDAGPRKPTSIGPRLLRIVIWVAAIAPTINRRLASHER